MATAIRTENPRWKRTESAAKAPAHELVVDKLLLSVIIGLVLFGTVMVYSASAVLAQKQFENQYYFLLKQGVWLVAGLVAMFIGITIDYRRYNRPEVVASLIGISIVLLVMVFFFPKVNGAHRWIRIGTLFSLQPSELSKLGLIVFLGYYLEKRGKEVTNFTTTILPATVVACAIIGLVALESDLGTAMMLALIFASMTYHAGARIRHLVGLGLAALPVLLGMIFLVDWRTNRIFAFLDPWKYRETFGYQAVQAMMAFGSGGLSGVGFAQSKQKLFFLPAAHTDFIFAVIGEELGLVGSLTVVALFALVAWRGVRAARAAPDQFGQLMAIGITAMIVGQACFNMSVTLSLVPNKGIPLPFISAGGSSLAISLFAAGVLLNISKHAKMEKF